MSKNSSYNVSSNQQQWGILLVLISVGIGTLMLFLDWFQISYVADSTLGHVHIGSYPIKLIDILLHTIKPPPGISQPYISWVIIGEIYVYIVGILFWALCAILTLRTTRSLKWLFPTSGAYIILVGCLLVFQQMWMSLSALSAPYVGVMPTIYQWLLLLYCGGILSGSYLISK